MKSLSGMSALSLREQESLLARMIGTMEFLESRTISLIRLPGVPRMSVQPSVQLMRQQW